MSPITLIVRPYRSPRTGNRVYGQFEARLDGKLICISRQPLLDGARVLDTEGIHPATPIATRHEGTGYDALRSTVGVAAKLTVEENERVGPRFGRWRPFPRSAVGAPMNFSGEGLSDTGQTAERLHEAAAVQPSPCITDYSNEKRTRWERPRLLPARRLP
jgi:hypothetical protein